MTPTELRTAWHTKLFVCHVKDGQLSHLLGDETVPRRCVKVPPVFPPKHSMTAARLLEEFKAVVEEAREYASRAAGAVAAGRREAKLAAFLPDAERLTKHFELALARRLMTARRPPVAAPHA